MKPTLFKISSLLLLLFLFVAGCQKDEPRTPVFAGIYDADMLYHEFNPPFQIALQTDSTKDIQYGIDSIDIDLDGMFDLFISQRIYLDWRDDFNRLYLKDYNFPFSGFTLQNGLEVASKKETFSIGLGHTNGTRWVDTLHYESRIDKIDYWQNSGDKTWLLNTNIWSWAAPPITFWGSYGTWYKLINTEMYIGIRMIDNLDYKLGWIKVKVYSRDNFEIVSYAIEK
ncbi:MAG: hypothetical protein ABFS35_22760 [Bacteroidota bacterium]